MHCWIRFPLEHRNLCISHWTLLKLDSYYWNKNAYLQAHHVLRRAPIQNDLNLKNWWAYFLNASSFKKWYNAFFLLRQNSKWVDIYSYLRHLHHFDAHEEDARVWWHHAHWIIPWFRWMYHFSKKCIIKNMHYL